MSGLFEIFFSPGKVFEQVRDRSMFLPALLAVMALSIGYFAVLANLVGMETMARKQLENGSSFTANLTPEQREQAIRQSSTPTRLVIGYCAAGIGSVVTLLVIAGLALGGLAMGGGKIKFTQALGATAYAAVPFSLLNIVMSTAILLATPDRDTLDFTNLIATNVGAFLDPQITRKAILSIAKSLDAISLAHIGFLSFGLSKVSRVSFGGCGMIIGAMWLIYVLGKAGLSALF